jgi:hypothetical protein
MTVYLINAKTFAIGFSLEEVVLLVDGAGNNNLLDGSKDGAILGADLSGLSGGKIHGHGCGL